LDDKLIRMSDPDTRDAAVALNRQRWGTTKLDGAVEVVIERREQLASAQRARLLTALGDGERDGDDAR
jgi:hypothetical protein